MNFVSDSSQSFSKSESRALARQLAAQMNRPSVKRLNQRQLSQLQAALAAYPDGVPRPEYPRPQFRRAEWQCLNGLWDVAFDGYRQGFHGRWMDGLPNKPKLPILVPFAYQWKASGIEAKGIQEILWYEREFEVPSQWTARGDDILLHFGAADYKTVVWVNGQEAGNNQGGHVPFTLDITPYLKKGKNRLIVRVEDTQDPHQPRGKQSVTGQAWSIDYTCTTGIWQSVWLEPVPPMRVDHLRLRPVLGQNGQNDLMELQAFLHAPAGCWCLQAEAIDPDTGEVVARAERNTTGAVARLGLSIPNAKRWSPDAPHLYDLRVRLLQDDKTFDEVESYFGLREVELREGKMWLNGEPIYLKMVLDQGYWPESGMTAPTDEALRADVEWCKKFGFNGARKHQKVEDPRYLYWCDKLGLLVWGEMANARAWNPQAEEWFVAEWERVVRRDVNHPCIITWVPLNETWGLPGLRDAEHPAQYAFAERLVTLTRRLDPDRPVVDNDGWQHTDVTDILAIHDYAKSGKALRKRYAKKLNGGALPKNAGDSGYPIFVRGSQYHGQPIMLTEVGGFLMHPPGLPKEKWDELYLAYGTHATAEELWAKYEDLMHGLADLHFVSGWCYTQLTDIEQEMNGLLTPDRQPKIAPEKFAALHRELFPAG